MTVEFSAALIAFVVAGLGVGAAAASGPVHAPNARSNHAAPTPVGGGIGVVAACGAVWLWLAQQPEVAAALDAPRPFAGVILIGLVLAALGVVDDLFDLPAAPKFVVLAGLSVLLVLHTGAPEALAIAANLAVPTPGLVGLFGASLFVFTLTNATNFLDGSNGLIGGSGAAAAMGLAVLGHATGAIEAVWIGLGLAAALLGFLPWNAPQARVFLGDAGSLFVGGLLAAGGLYVTAAEPRAVWLAPLLALPWLADALLTLAWRARAGERLGVAHRDHLYQRAIAAGASHTKVAAVMAAATSLCALLAWACLVYAPDAGALALAAASALAFVAHRALRRRFDAACADQ